MDRLQELYGQKTMLEDDIEYNKFIKRIRLKNEKNTNIDALAAYGTSNYINITVIEGRNLRAVDIGGTSDPYTTLKLQKSNAYAQTAYKPSTLNPIWKETVHFKYSDKNDVLEVRVLDRDAVGKDEIIGVVFIRFNSLYLRSQKPVDKMYTLRDEAYYRPARVKRRKEKAEQKKKKDKEDNDPEAELKKREEELNENKKKALDDF